MSTSIRIDDQLYNDAKVQGKAECRSPSNQISYWAKVGKAALENPDLPVEFVRDLLLTMNEDAEPFEYEYS